MNELVERLRQTELTGMDTLGLFSEAADAIESRDKTIERFTDLSKVVHVLFNESGPAGYVYQNHGDKEQWEAYDWLKAYVKSCDEERIELAFRTEKFANDL